MDRRTLKSRWGGRRQTEKSRWRGGVGRGSLGEESMGEQAALPNFKDNHLKKTSAQSRSQGSCGQIAFGGKFHLGRGQCNKWQWRDGTTDQPRVGLRGHPRVTARLIYKKQESDKKRYQKCLFHLQNQPFEECCHFGTTCWYSEIRRYIKHSNFNSPRFVLLTTVFQNPLKNTLIFIRY